MYNFSLFKKINKNIIKHLLFTIFSIILVLLIGFLLINYYRDDIFKYFAEGYLKSLENIPKIDNNDNKIVKNQIENLISLDKKDEKINENKELSIVDTVKKTNPAVVSIIISKEVPKYETYIDENNNNNPFGDFFPGFIFNVPQYRQNGTEKKEIGGGSGFFVSSDGLIVTNRHVVDTDGVEYTVFTNDGKKYDAKVIARDPVLDIALIKISGNNFQYLTLGDSDKLEVGQSVIAIGNALAEFKNTVSVGIISGLSRSITAGNNQGTSEFFDHVIQTDAAINQGNSGGPLLDLYGKVIGVNVAMVQGSQSIGFALPINSVRSVIDSVKKTGKIIRPYLGIRYVLINKEIQTKNSLSVDYGVLVKGGTNQNELAVIPGSPADKAGIVENDIILEIDGIKLDGKISLSSFIRNKNVGDIISLKIIHKGIEKTVRVALESAK